VDRAAMMNTETFQALAFFAIVAVLLIAFLA
jgi:hypothetical protein